MPVKYSCLLLLFVALASPSAAFAQAEPELTAVAAESVPPVAFEGRYRFVSGRDGVRRAVDAVCDRLDFVTRAFARPILEDRNQPYAIVELALDAQLSTFTLGAWGPVRTRLGATRAVRNERGETVHVQQMLRGRVLTQTLRTDQGTRRNVLSLSEDGATLIIDTVITSPRLPIPLRYRLVYRREGGGALLS